MVQLLYWLSLSTWFGSVLFIALAAPIVFRTVRENNPILSHVLSVNLDGQHSTLLGGTILLNLLSRLLQVELVCAATLLITLILQPLLIDLHGANGNAAIIRSALFLLSAGLVIYDWQFVTPKIRSNREEYVEHADEPEIANPALDRFDRAQQRSLLLLAVVAMLLVGMILFSSTLGAFTLIEATQKAGR